MSPISIFVPPLAAWVRGQPVDEPAADLLPFCGGSFPLSSGRQRPAAAGDFRSRINKDGGKTSVPAAVAPASSTYHQELLTR